MGLTLDGRPSLLLHELMWMDTDMAPVLSVLCGLWHDPAISHRLTVGQEKLTMQFFKEFPRDSLPAGLQT